MKKLTIITFLLIGFLLKAQQQELIDNTWYLEKLVINDTEYLTPDNEEISIISATFHGNTLFTHVCNWMTGGIEFNNEDYTFSNISGSWGSSMIDCTLSENENFENIYFYEYWNDGFIANIPDPFHYEITSEENSLQLIVTNSLGSKAYYNNVQLSTSDISDPNPENFQLAFQKDDLIIKSSKSIAKSVSIYDLMGKSVLKAKIENNRINTNKLPQGIYIVKIADEKGKIFSKKVRKN